jgi:hypothetical protein
MRTVKVNNQKNLSRQEEEYAEKLKNGILTKEQTGESVKKENEVKKTEDSSADK